MFLGIIGVEGLEVSSRVGVSEEERGRVQTLKLDLHIQADWSDALEEDRVEKTICYAQLASFVRSFIEQRTWSLLESLAADLVHELLATYPLFWVRLRVAKPAILPQVKAAFVEVERFGDEER